MGVVASVVQDNCIQVAGEGSNMFDYIIAGIAAVMLLMHLFYALLKPERL
jgi:K+-transporting ATPase KdpF subunit